ncbi:MAG: hypothetical protein PCFJNLEI_02580 [Verrucomicrobiae bacterium]|nr:hypothetical protein [Verrucomicrobiae bacterium]
MCCAGGVFMAIKTPNRKKMDPAKLKPFRAPTFNTSATNLSFEVATKLNAGPTREALVAGKFTLSAADELMVINGHKPPVGFRGKNCVHLQLEKLVTQIATSNLAVQGSTHVRDCVVTGAASETGVALGNRRDGFVLAKGGGGATMQFCLGAGNAWAEYDAKDLKAWSVGNTFRRCPMPGESILFQELPCGRIFGQAQNSIVRRHSND